MKVGFSLFGMSTRHFSAVARKADELGYESIWAPEHLVFPAEVPATYPMAADRRAPVTSDTPLLDPWAALSYLAASTERIRLGTGVYILPLRNPFVTARAVATLDRLSNGRAILGIGVGWLQQEFEAVGENWQDRAPRTAEIMEIIRRLWTEDVIEFHGKYYSFGPVKFRPKPVQHPLPIHVGGISAPALRRAAQLGDGWFGSGHSPEETRQFVERLTALRRAAGRDGQPFEVTVGCNVPPTVDNLRRYQEAGAARVTLAPWGRPPGGRLTAEFAIEGLERFADEVLSKVGD